MLLFLHLCDLDFYFTPLQRKLFIDDYVLNFDYFVNRSIDLGFPLNIHEYQEATRIITYFY